jgi:hypothetical protein
MNIDITSSNDDSDFVNPPSKRNRGPKQEVRNIPRQPRRQAAMHTDGEAAVKNHRSYYYYFQLLMSQRGICAQYLNCLPLSTTCRCSLLNHHTVP